MAKNPWTGKGRPGDRKKARRKRGLFNFNYEPKTQIPREINIKKIKVEEGRRALNSGKVKELVQSINALDLQTPITVRPVSYNRGWKDPDYALVSGLHRLEAMKQLKRTKIAAVVTLVGKHDARMWEISENLHRAELTPLEHDEQVAEWVKLWQLTSAISGQHVRKFGRGRPRSGNAEAARNLPVKGNSDEAKRRTVSRAIKVAGISGPAKKAAKETGIDKNHSYLLKVAAEKTPKAQLEKVMELSSPNSKSSDDYQETVEELMNLWNATRMLKRAFNDAPYDVRQSFVEEIMATARPQRLH